MPYFISVLQRNLGTLPLFWKRGMGKFSWKAQRLWAQKVLGSNSGSELERSCLFAHELKLSTVCFLYSQMEITSLTWQE